METSATLVNEEDSLEQEQNNQVIKFDIKSMVSAENNTSLVSSIDDPLTYYCKKGTREDQ